MEETWVYFANWGILKNLRCSSKSSPVVLALQGSTYELARFWVRHMSFKTWLCQAPTIKLTAWKRLKPSARLGESNRYTVHAQWNIDITFIIILSYYDTQSLHLPLRPPPFFHSQFSHFSTSTLKYNFYLTTVYENFLWMGKGMLKEWRTIDFISFNNCIVSASLFALPFDLPWNS